MVERGGRIKVAKIPNRETHIILRQIQKNIKVGSQLMTDEFRVYSKVRGMGYHQASIKHGKQHYVRGSVHTNTIEGFWGQLKRSIDGTYHAVSPKHLQAYLDEFAFRYNHRFSPVFSMMMARI